MKKRASPSRVKAWRMFDRIAPRYDLLNRLLSLRLDINWRRKAASFLPSGKNLRLLDIATGTGDQILAFFRKSDRIQDAVGIDLSEEMLNVAREKIHRHSLSQTVTLVKGDATRLSYADCRFDAVSISFGIRNVIDVPRALSEMRRVLQHGGRAIILEFSLPKNRIILLGHSIYLRYILPRLGALISGDQEAYRYLNRTVETFPYGKAFCKMMEQAGFSQVHAYPLTFGIVTIYCGDRA
ncbi:MAG: bifunctional demethylmenaquinone methyltransferase/2-methoxy-6-polyprenyl-1,4-benzoquinol methylase [Candidatus Cloacimonetes bacterium 4572_55]|nr:MAG: bifunctional demethylmenaquinone methyltransferase/2-methoxy-6-polyprenyl-1,4-benzoquinol methylase [Candidatus Cloacimonetes bacterium 4572_55]